MQDDRIPQRPYLYRAMHEWMTDSGQTPHIAVDATADGVSVPREFVQDGRIVLNISYAATENLDLSRTGISFQARFAGKPFAVSVPASAVLAIYARETGEGMVFSSQPPSGEQSIANEEFGVIADSADYSADQAPAIDRDNADRPRRSGARSHLRVIK